MQVSFYEGKEGPPQPSAPSRKALPTPSTQSSASTLEQLSAPRFQGLAGLTQVTASSVPTQPVGQVAGPVSSTESASRIGARTRPIIRQHPSKVPDYVSRALKIPPPAPALGELRVETLSHSSFYRSYRKLDGARALDPGDVREPKVSSTWQRVNRGIYIYIVCVCVDLAASWCFGSHTL